MPAFQSPCPTERTIKNSQPRSASYFSIVFYFSELSDAVCNAHRWSQVAWSASLRPSRDLQVSLLAVNSITLSLINDCSAVKACSLATAGW